MTNTNQPAATMSPELVLLREAFLRHVRTLIATYPAQAANEMHYLRQAATAQLGRMRRGVESKGALSVMHKSELVLVWVPDWSLADSVTVYHPRNTCTTSVQKYAVEVVS